MRRLAMSDLPRLLSGASLVRWRGTMTACARCTWQLADDKGHGLPQRVEDGAHESASDPFALADASADPFCPPTSGGAA